MSDIVIGRHRQTGLIGVRVATDQGVLVASRLTPGQADHFLLELEVRSSAEQGAMFRQLLERVLSVPRGQVVPGAETVSDEAFGW